MDYFNMKVEDVVNIKGRVTMETSSGGGSEEHRASNCLVEEEYTIAIPLVRPKSSFLQFLNEAGASSEVFTRKEILQLLKKYIVARKLFDETDPRVVHCKGDPLGDVFGVDQFTINDVLDLLARHCIQLPDTKLKRQRRLVSKPPSSISCAGNPSSSFTISVCRAPADGSSPVISSTSGNKLYTQKCTLPPGLQRKASTSSNYDTSDSTDSTCKKNKHRGKENSQKLHRCADLKAETPSVDSPGQDKLGNRGDSSEEGTTSNSHSDKRKGSSSPNYGSARKRHKTEPGNLPMPGTSQQTSASTSSESVRQRSTSLSIRYSGEDANGDYPWYFQLDMGDGSDGDSEVLSVQDKETVIVQDSTDDLWFLEEESISVEVPSDTEFSVEYDIESDISPPTESDISSIRSGEGLLVVCQESDVEFFADCSETDSNDGDKELTLEDNWSCQECSFSNTPFQRYCSRCWKLRSDWLPTDPDEKSDSHHRCKNAAAGGDETAFSTRVCNRKEQTDSGLGSLCSTQPSSQETHVSDISLVDDSVFKNTSVDKLKQSATCELNMFDSLIEEAKNVETRYTFSNVQLKHESRGEMAVDSKNVASSDSESAKQEVKAASSALDDPCMICLTRPKNASLIHGTSGHQVCCLACAKRLKRRGKLCPVCRRPIQKVIKNYIL